MRRIGVYGGTFDPIHLGHLILAEQCREAGRLDEVWFVPSGRQPLKQDHAITDFDRRVEMIELAIAGQPAFRIEPIEKEMTGLTYTADMLALLHQRHPDDELFFLLGSDSLQDLHCWHDPHRVIASATLLVMLRAGHATLTAEQLRAALSLPAQLELRLEFVPEPPLIDLASSDLRRRIAAGRSIRYLVPRSVECYIADHRLYRDVKRGSP